MLSGRNVIGNRLSERMAEEEGGPSTQESNSQGRDPGTRGKDNTSMKMSFKKSRRTFFKIVAEERQQWSEVERLHDQIEEAERLCCGVQEGKISQLGKLPGKDGAARRNAGTKEEVYQENGMVD